MRSPYLKIKTQKTWPPKSTTGSSHPAERADYSRKYLESGAQFEQQSCMRQMERMLFDAVALGGEPA